MAIIKNQVPYGDYNFTKELDAISYYEKNRINKEFKMLKNIFMYSDNAKVTSACTFSIYFYKSSDKDKFLEIEIEKDEDKFKIGVYSNDENIRSLMEITNVRKVAKTLEEAHGILNEFICSVHHITRQIDVEFPLIDDEDYWENTRKEYYETLEKISNGKVKEIYR